METLSNLQHRGIVQYIEAGVDGEGNDYIVMPFIKGKDLRKATSGQDPTFTLSLYDSSLEPLSYSQQQGVLHRDVKPANIIVRESDMQPFILDFGFAYWLDNETSDSLTSRQFGTTAYIPVEVFSS
ncbi:MAG: protein kinase [Planctomycetota bacterium]